MNLWKSSTAMSAIEHARLWDKLKALIGYNRMPVGHRFRAPDAEMATWPLPPVPASIRRARRLTRAQAAEWRAGGHGKTAELLVSELVTKALHDANEPIQLTLWSINGTLRCEVEYTDPALPHEHQAGPDGEQGRWVSLIDQLACCWGSTFTTTGKAVWFELPEPALPSG